MLPALETRLLKVRGDRVENLDTAGYVKFDLLGDASSPCPDTDVVADGGVRCVADVDAAAAVSDALGMCGGIMIGGCADAYG